MIDRVDMNMNTLGSLAYLVGNTGTGMDATSTRSDSPHALLAQGDQVHIDAVVERTVPFHQPSPDVPREQVSESVSAQRAAMQPYLGGNFDLAREIGPLPQYENPFRANAMDVKTVEQSTGAVLSMWA